MPTWFTFFLFTGLLASIGYAQNRWESLEAFQDGDVMTDLVRGDNGRLVASGWGAILYSDDDGLSWMPAETPPPAWEWRMNAIAFGEGIYAVAGGNQVFTSRDGSNWQSVIPNSGITDVSYLGGRFIGLSYRNPFVVSEDGIEWEILLLDHPNGAYKRLSYGNGVYLIQIDDRIGHSVNARDWEWNPAPQWAPDARSPNLHYLEGAFWSYGDRVFRSVDGINWEEMSPTHRFSAIKVVSWKGRYWALAEEPGILWDIADRILVSSDGLNWEVHAKGERSLFGMAVDQEIDCLYILGGVPEVSRQINRQNYRFFTRCETPEAVSMPWFPINATLGDLVSHPSGLIARSGTERLARSVNGQDWAVIESIGENNVSPGYLAMAGETLFVQSVDRQQFFHSSDGQTWHQASLPPEGRIYAIHRRGDHWIAVGAGQYYAGWDAIAPYALHEDTGGTVSPKATVVIPSPAIYRSDDLDSWIPIGLLLLARGPLRAIAEGNGLLVAAGGGEHGGYHPYAPGSQGYIVLSDDGINWELIETEPGLSPLTSAVFFQGKFYLSTESSAVLTSPDGRSWESILLNDLSVDSLHINRKGQLLALDRGGRLAVSSNGMDWILKEALDPRHGTMTSAFTEFQGSYYWGGTGGVFQRSPANNLWTADQQPEGWSAWPGFGSFYEEPWGYAFHPHLGWIYLDSGSLEAGDPYWHHPDWGWMWMRPAWLPWHYRYMDGAWLYQLDGGNWFYNTLNQLWERAG